MRKLAGMMLAVFAAAVPAAHADVGPLVRLTSCAQGPARSATFEGDMSATPRSARLQMRFTLQVRSMQAPRWTRVAAPTFGQWISAAPGKTRFVYDKTVQNLVAPAEYRASVLFRWRAADGTVLGTLRRHSRPCRQVDPRPDLTAVTIHVVRGTNVDTRLYEVVIRNTGRGASDPFAISLEVNGVRQPDNMGPGLASGESAVATFEAPKCNAGTEVTATVDPSDSIDEADETDNTVSIPCPADGR